MWDGAIFHLLLASVPSKIITVFCILYTSHLYLRPPKAGDSRGIARLKCQQESEIFLFILYFTVKTNVYQNLIKLVFSLI